MNEIIDIIESGSIEQLRLLSRFYYRVNDKYRENIDFLASLPLYDTIVIPIYQAGKDSKAQILKAVDNACAFIERLDIPNTFTHITKQWLITGIYNGILREDGDKIIIQDLPVEYCRCRYKDFNNLNVLEFNVAYFNTILDDYEREQTVKTFPPVIRKAWAEYKNRGLICPWVEVPAADGGVSFSFANDCTPLLIASIPALRKYDDAIAREEKRDENELYKLLIHRMPVNSKGELVFQLPEAGKLHEAIADMLEDIDTVDVLTTFGEATLENLQDSSASAQSQNRLEKYKNNAWSALGRGEILFNANNSSTLAYELKKDESLMISYLNVYEHWIKFHLNERFSRKNLSFDFKILPTTVFNRADIQKSMLQAAQYGYSKIYAGIAFGLKQRDQLSLINFENDLLNLTDNMRPLQSSYTTSNSEEKNSSNSKNSSGKSKDSSLPQNISNTGGRPELPDEQKSEKTQANIAAMG